MSIEPDLMVFFPASALRFAAREPAAQGIGLFFSVTHHLPHQRASAPQGRSGLTLRRASGADHLQSRLFLLAATLAVISCAVYPVMRNSQ
jgi:hypothetical protein